MAILTTARPSIRYFKHKPAELQLNRALLAV